jgi:hypothetical protein
MLCACAVLLLSLAVPKASSAQTAAEPQTTTAQLYKTLAGEWVGTCEQTTDGEPTENKYFQAVIKETSPNVFTSTFTYFKSDGATDKPVQIGSTKVVSTVQPDGTVKNDIQGEGTVLVENKPKNQTHKLSEVLTAEGHSSYSGKIGGKISVDGLPFGLGKNGRVSSGTSTYALNGDVLTINQKVTATFKILIAKKSFNITMNSTAKRGTDVAALMKADRIAKTQPVGTKGS